MANTIIKNVNIVTMNQRKDIIVDGFIVIEGDSIAFIGTREQFGQYEKSKDYKILDGNNGILMPGMINTHCHVPMVAFRSLGDDVPDRLKRYIFPLEMMLVDEELVYKGTKYGVAEMLLGGVTTYCDCYYFEDEVARASKEMGIRGVLSETIVDFKAPNTDRPYGGIEYSEEFFKKWSYDELITPAITCHALYTNDSQHLKIAHSLARKYNVPMIMHVAEMDYEQKKCRDEFNMTPVQYLDSLGILDDKFIGVHLVNVNESDIDILEKRKIGVSHNAGSNAKGAKGVAPVKEMYKRGLKLGLGTDGPMSGNTLDILTQMPLVGKIHKLHNMDRTVFPAAEIVEMATIGGARVLNMENFVGSVEVGKKADLVILETESVNMCPIYDYYSAIVYSANPGNVDTVFVNGQMLVHEKKLVRKNLREVRNDFLLLKEKVLDAASKL